MKDEVTYELPVDAGLLLPFAIRPQLRAIFTYRARRVAEWSAGIMVRRVR
jgi:ligand-binding SRPBCC domain-containing protein